MPRVRNLRSQFRKEPESQLLLLRFTTIVRDCCRECLYWFSPFSLARYWNDPHSFKPERFLGDWPRDAFLAFSGGEHSQNLQGMVLVTVHQALALALEESEFAYYLLWSPFNLHWPNFFSKRFFETEATVILSMLVSRYKITIKEEPRFAGETFEQRKNRVLKCWNGLTLTWVFSTRVPIYSMVLILRCLADQLVFPLRSRDDLEK